MCEGPICQTAIVKMATFALQVISKDIDHLYMSGDEEERKSIQQTSQMFAAQITQLLFKVPRVLLLLLKTNDCLRSVDLALGEVRAVGNLLSRCVMYVQGIKRWYTSTQLKCSFPIACAKCLRAVGVASFHSMQMPSALLSHLSTLHIQPGLLSAHAYCVNHLS